VLYKIAHKRFTGKTPTAVGLLFTGSRGIYHEHFALNSAFQVDIVIKGKLRPEIY
jgi:hypothetical protein